MNKPLINIGVITNIQSEPVEQLINAANLAGASLEIIPFDFISLTNLRVSELVKTLLTYDIIYYRTGMKDVALTEIALILAENNIPLINAGKPNCQSHKKIQQALIANRYHIPQPKSLVIKNASYQTATKILGPTFVGKPNVGSKGNRVELISSQLELDTYLNGQKADDHLFQELITEAEEYRVYTIGGLGVASYKKEPSPDDFRANLHVGGQLIATEPERAESLLNFASKIAKIFNADISGIDLLYKDGQILFLEINWQPGWSQVWELTGVDFPQLTVEFILSQVVSEIN